MMLTRDVLSKSSIYLWSKGRMGIMNLNILGTYWFFICFALDS